MDAETREAVALAVRELTFPTLLGQRLVSTRRIGFVAAGSEWTQVVPAGVVWELLAIQAGFTASAVVATRSPRLQITDGSFLVFEAAPAIQPTASQVARFSYARNWGYQSIANVANVSNQGLPDFALLGGYVIQSATSNLDAGDQWGAVSMLVREWTIEQIAQQADWIASRLR